ncbi:hypothetical protein [Nocardia neocaledoniensis]|uniref:hypothetical protein n=1 Tax=Nocardia neocaledoniensis TaxID=236511 RepID=UPI002453E679|nr:hypothetical protein [Nocardia neocaledoniensis]
MASAIFAIGEHSHGERAGWATGLHDDAGGGSFGGDDRSRRGAVGAVVGGATGGFIAAGM